MDKKLMKKKYPLLFEQNEQSFDMKRYNQALGKARLAADILKQEFGARKVWLFGSLNKKEGFQQGSDIDLAEIGIPAKKFVQAYAKITRVITEFKIDLVDMNDCRESIRRVIDKEGILL